MRIYVIDAARVAEEAGLGKTLGTVMQACFFALAGVLDRDAAITAIKREIKRTYGKRGDVVVNRNHAAVDLAITRMVEVHIPERAERGRARLPILADLGTKPSTFVERVTAVLMAGRGDLLPVSAFPIDGVWPVGTSAWEKRSIALALPRWDPAVCIQCNKCALICPHASIRTKVFDAAHLADAPAGMPSTIYKAKEHAGAAYVVQVAPDDCTGCGLCVAFCPAKDKTNPRHKAIDMVPAAETREAERARWSFVSALPATDRRRVHLDVKGSQLLEPLFEFSGACGGCGETPYIKLVTQLFGDRAIVANATGCSSIYGGNLPTTPWRADASGRGPAWANSLFEDNAEFGLGLRLGVDALRERARSLVRELAGSIGDELATALADDAQHDEAAIHAQRERVAALRARLAERPDARSRELARLADYLVTKSVWLIGGDGWAYDIGYGGLDHVLASGANINALVLDTEAYSNTGGQQSKATPTGAAAKFASAGKLVPKKDLGLLAMSYGHVYVARVAIGAKDKHTVDAIREAESWHGPSLVIAYSPCIVHGYDLAHGADQQRLAVESGVWPLYRFDPRRAERGEPALQLDVVGPGNRSKIREYMRNEGRFRVVELQDPKRFEAAVAAQEHQAERRLALYQQLASVAGPGRGGQPS
jgi:pyruvate-ferredoxin/flavodoxin oxidoreductase